jgi:beta-barrel assembly-enhancing protease
MRIAVRHRALCGLLALGLWAPGPGWPQAGPPTAAHSLPGLGDGGDLSLSDERRLGDRIARGLYRDPALLDDAPLHDYLQALWQPLLASAQAQGEISPELAERFAWVVLLARDRSVNAFALPGGYFGVHLGLIGSVSTPAELASVLAHEISHVSQRHIARLIARQDRQAPWVVGAMILGALAASAARNADVANAAIVGGQAVAAQSQLNFSRDMEREADRVGLNILIGAGFEAQGFVSMFGKLQQAARLNDDGAFPYLRSHPLTSERMADMQARLPGVATAPPLAAPVSAHWHAQMAARARVLADPGIDRLRALAASGRQALGPQADADASGARYGAALAALQLRDPGLALAMLNALLAGLPPEPQARLAADTLALEVLLAWPQARLADGRGLAELRQAGLRSPTRSLRLLAAQACLQADATALLGPALQQLRTWTALHPLDAPAWQLQARLHQARREPAQAARAEAEARLARLDLPGALDRLQAAQRLARQGAGLDHVELSILDARVREVDALLRQQTQDELRPEG